MQVIKVLLLSCALVLYCGNALAQNATAFKDTAGKVFLYGQQPSTKVGVSITADFTKTIQANSCGLVVVKFTSSFPVGTFQIDGQTINPTSITAVQMISTNCAQMANYPATFKTATGEVIIKKTAGVDYKVVFPSHTVTRQVLANACGYAVLKNTNTTLLNLPTATGGRANFAYASLPVAQALSCAKGVLYFAKGFDVKSGNSLIISSIPPGTYTVANAANLSQSKVYTVTGKGCLVGDRTTIGSPSKFLVSRQGLTFPIDWASLTTIPVAAIPQC